MFVIMTGEDVRKMIPVLEFPQDKAEYIPSFITLAIFFIGAAITTYIIYKKSKKDEKEFRQEYDKELSEYQDKHY
jgi:hypothetical protein